MARKQPNELTHYQRPAMWDEDFELLDALAQASNLSKPALLRIAIRGLIRKDEPVRTAGRRIADELETQS